MELNSYTTKRCKLIMYYTALKLLQLCQRDKARHLFLLGLSELDYYKLYEYSLSDSDGGCLEFVRCEEEN